MTELSNKSQAEILSELPSPVTVVGLGKTGLSCARFFEKNMIQFAVVDSREAPPELAKLRKNCPAAPVFLGSFDFDAISNAGTLVVSPGVSIETPQIAEAVEKGAILLGDVEVFARLVDAPVVAVTGSNGKSTVTTLVVSMCEAAGKRVRAGGNLGTPVLDLLDETETDLFVIELSSFQLETTFSLDASSVAVLNISADHMDRYPNLESYVSAKAKIFCGSGFAITNRDDDQVAQMDTGIRSGFSFGAGSPANDNEFGIRDLDGQKYLACGNKNLLLTADVKIPGEHNLLNCLAALALGKSIGLEWSSMARAITEFVGLAHRTQWIASEDGVDWYNDSKGTNVGASLAAIVGMDRPVILIAGGDGKGADFSPLRAVMGLHVKVLIVVGKDAQRLAAAVSDLVLVRFASDMTEAVSLAAEFSHEGDAVLLSPACASLDMYSDYAARGDAFAEAVQNRMTGT